jgi:16S rRNA (guanine527-N7)-methyltransferase
VTQPFSEALRALDLELTGEQVSRLTRYRDLLATSANEFNLTSLRDPQAIERRHLIESLALGVLLGEHGLLPTSVAHESMGGDGPYRVLDIGTGAGLPGIPLKIAWPAIHLTLLESVGKKCRFLEQACEALGLDNSEVVEGRAEDFGRDANRREAYDLALARAVAPLAVLMEYALPALRVGGWLAAQKGSAADSELAAATQAFGVLGGRLHEAVPFRPPAGLEQTVLLIEKVAPTPERYPRRAGIPSKRPL